MLIGINYIYENGVKIFDLTNKKYEKCELIIHRDKNTSEVTNERFNNKTK